MTERGFFGITPERLKTIADELTEAVEAMSDNDPECLLDVEFKDYAEGDQGTLEGPLLCVSISEYPEEGVYPIDQSGNEETRKTRVPQAAQRQGGEAVAYLYDDEFWRPDQLTGSERANALPLIPALPDTQAPEDT